MICIAINEVNESYEIPIIKVHCCLFPMVLAETPHECAPVCPRSCMANCPLPALTTY
jgi:hypothetical protein